MRRLKVLIGVIILLLLAVQLGRQRLGWERFAEHAWFVAVDRRAGGFRHHGQQCGRAGDEHLPGQQATG